MTPTMPHEPIPAGTRIRFTRKVTQRVSNTYTLLLAEKGWTGEIVGESGRKRWPYRVRADRSISAFVSNLDEFEIAA